MSLDNSTREAFLEQVKRWKSIGIEQAPHKRIRCVVYGKEHYDEIGEQVLSSLPRALSDATNEAGAPEIEFPKYNNIARWLNDSPNETFFVITPQEKFTTITLMYNTTIHGAIEAVGPLWRSKADNIFAGLECIDAVLGKYTVPELNTRADTLLRKRAEF